MGTEIGQAEKKKPIFCSTYPESVMGKWWGKSLGMESKEEWEGPS